MPFLLGYITTKDVEQAQAIGRELVTARLAGCVNILPGMRSIYVWKEKLEESTEAVLIVKTDSAHTAKCSALIKRLHSYDCPCVIWLPITEGNPDYLRWLASGIGPETL